MSEYLDENQIEMRIKETEDWDRLCELEGMLQLLNKEQKIEIGDRVRATYSDESESFIGKVVKKRVNTNGKHIEFILEYEGKNPEDDENDLSGWGLNNLELIKDG